MAAPLRNDALVRGLVATARFGLGAAPGEIATASADPRGWVLQQLKPQPIPAVFAGLPTGDQATLKFEQQRQALAQARRASPDSNQPSAAPQPATPQIVSPSTAAPAKPFRPNLNARLVSPPGGNEQQGDAYLPREVYVREAAARLRAQVDTPVPVYERLVAFWSNHFTVSVQRPPVLGLAGPFEREAIRPHVLGRFEDMLLAVARHQAMLLYLDNALSIGPRSRIGQTRERGLNENLAREILELHTLGVDGGYGQDDVRALAMILTGWSIARGQEPNPGAFRFRPFAHEPGEKILLGRRYAEGGEGEGVQALRELAHRPATAQHVATKLARHFISDDPPKASIDRLSAAYQRSGGDLGVVTRALVEDEAAWAAPLGKVRQPIELVVATLRALGVPRDRPEARQIDDRPLLGSLRRLGQAPFAAPSPAGWPDTAQDWVAPEAMMRRIEWASAVASRLPAEFAPMMLLETAIGPVASAETRTQVERAPSARDGLALVLASPEFQRR